MESCNHILAYQYLYKRFTQDKVHIALVHPIVSEDHDMALPITKEYMQEWIRNNNLMNTPMLLAMKLIGYN